MQIDLNCDCGESYGRWELGDDAAMFHYVSSANVACGAHAGDPDVMRQTVRQAKAAGVSVGAHPGFPDLLGFGRRVVQMSPDEVFNSVLAQIGALYAIAKVEGVTLAHVKAHGALYNYAAVNPPVAQAIADANPNSPLAHLLPQFKRWYSQSGTTRLLAEGVFNKVLPIFRAP